MRWLAISVAARRARIAGFEAATEGGTAEPDAARTGAAKSALRMERDALDRIGSSDPRYAPLRGREDFAALFLAGPPGVGATGR
jgi:hypothetical protein